MPGSATGLRAPLLWIVLPLAAGIAWSAQAPLPAGSIPGLLGLAAACAVAATVLGGRDSRAARATWAVLIALGAGIAGFVHAHRRAPGFGGDGGLPPREVRVELRIERLFTSRPDARTVQGLGRVSAAPAHRPELAGARVYFSTIRKANKAPPRRGATCTMRGVLAPMPRGGDADGFSDYLANLGIAASIRRAHVEAERTPPGPLLRLAETARTRLAARLRIGLEDQPALASVHLAMLLGEKAALTPDQEAAFLQSGTFHIFSVSGLHVGVIASAIQALLLLVRAPRPVRVVTGLAALWLYVLVVGANPPAVRAFLMAAFLLARGLCGLPGNPTAALAAAALATLLLDPRQLFTSGFQLSYLVVSALVLMGVPLAERWLDAWRPFSSLPEADWGWWRHGCRWVGRKIIGSIAITIAALLGGTMSTIACFGMFTPGALLANLVVVPLASLAIIGGFCAVVAGFLGLEPACSLFNHAAALSIVVMEWLARLAAGLPGAHFPAAFRAPWLEAAALVMPLALMLAGAANRWRAAAGGFWLPAGGVAFLVLACVRLG